MKDYSRSTRQFSYQTHKYGSQSPLPAGSTASGPRSTGGFLAMVGLAVAGTMALFAPAVVLTVVLAVVLAVLGGRFALKARDRYGRADRRRPPEHARSRGGYEPAD